MSLADLVTVLETAGSRLLRVLLLPVILFQFPFAIQPISGRAEPIRDSPTGISIVPGEVRVDVTYDHIGALWWVVGDDDLDSSMTLEFRKLGESIWQPAAPSMRAYPMILVDGDPLGLNYWAASALFLEQGTAYELRLSLSDPDGGGEVRIVTAMTRTWPQPDPNGRQLYVIPGTGGGDGSPGNPFQGLQAAADIAQPGDNFHIASGVYTPFQLLASGSESSPISFLGPGDGSAVVDGDGTAQGVITLGNYDQVIGYVLLSGLEIQNGAWGVDAQHSHDLLISRNVIQDVDFGIVNRREDGLEYDQTVCDNVIEGRTPWPGSGIPGERGVDLRGYGNVVCHNRIQYFGDCVSIQPFTGPSYGNDVYGNDISYCVDDGIEIDYNQANVRAWRNRVMNARMGVSVQPIRGGPAYILRNEFFNLESVPVKMHNQTTGFFVVHNTGAKHGDGYGDNGAMWRNVVLRNNLFLGTRYAFEFTTVPDEGFRDFDFDGWGTTREIDPGGPFFKWDDVRYDFLPDLPPGVEDHGVEIGFEDLMNAVLPPSWDTAAIPGSRDLRLVGGSGAIDNGQLLANLNGPFVLDGAPDLGAFEYGQPLPDYGPRLQVPDFSSSGMVASDTAPVFGQTLTFTITILNTGLPLSATAYLTNTLPLGLEYVPGSMSTTAGSADDGSAPTLTWSGVIPGNTPVVITYQVLTTESQTRAILNSAVLNAGAEGSLVLESMVVANGWQVFLPTVGREVP